MTLSIIIIITTVVFSALFSGLEIAFVTANKLKIELDKSRNKFSSKILSWLYQREASFLAMLLLGNNIVLVIYGMLMEQSLNPLLHNILPPAFDSAFYLLLFNTLTSTLIIIIFGEYIPKASFRLMANTAISFFSFLMLVLYIILFPVVFIFLKTSELIMKLFFNTKLKNEPYVFSTLDLSYFIQEFHHEDHDSQSEIGTDLQIFKNAINFRKTKIRDCMVPRTEITAVDKESNLKELIEIFAQSGHSKIPVYEEQIDNIIGYVHAYDLIDRPSHLNKILRNITFIPETMQANIMLNKMIKEGQSIAIVLDEFGGTSGLVTLEDLMEEIFGEIEDEFDTEQLVEKTIDSKTFVFSARLEIDYLNERYNLRLPESEEYTTLGGFLIHHQESIPHKGQKILIDGISFEVMQASNTKIDLVKLSLL